MGGVTNEITNSTDFTVEKKGADVKFKKFLVKFGLIGGPLIILMILCLVLSFTVPNAVGYVTGIFLIVMVPLYYCNLLPKFIFPAVFKYTEVEYEYVLKAGHFTINYIYGRKKRENYMPESLVSSMEVIAPYKDEYRKMVDEGKFDNEYIAYSVPDHVNNYCMIFANEKGEKCCAIFQCNEKILKILKFLNNNTVVGKIDEFAGYSEK